MGAANSQYTWCLLTSQALVGLKRARMSSQRPAEYAVIVAAFGHHSMAIQFRGCSPGSVSRLEFSAVSAMYCRTADNSWLFVACWILKANSYMSRECIQSSLISRLLRFISHPVLPKPPDPLSVSDTVFVFSSSTGAIGINIPCAMRS